MELEKESNLLPEWQADNLIIEIKELQADKERFTEVAKKKCENIMAELENRSSKIDNEIEFKKAQLRAYFMTVERKSTKTQETYSMFSGKLVMKKPTVKIKHDDKKILEWAEHNASKYVDQTVINKLNWRELKEILVISNGMIINKATNEVLEGVEGLSIEEVGEQFEIK
jgi:DNA gyrase/topoisomerase IV subunit A